MDAIIPTEDFKLHFPDNGSISIGMVGSGRAGKTSFLGHLLENYFRKHIGVLFTGSPQIDAYKAMDILQYDTFIPQVSKDMYAINKETKNHYNFLVVLDDIVTHKNNQELLKFWTIYRNSWIHSIVSVQDVTLWNAAGRNNISVVCLFKLNTDDRVEKVIKAYLKSYFPSGTRMIDMVKWYKKATEDYHFIVIDQIRDKIYRTKINL